MLFSFHFTQCKDHLPHLKKKVIFPGHVSYQPMTQQSWHLCAKLFPMQIPGETLLRVWECVFLMSMLYFEKLIIFLSCVALSFRLSLPTLWVFGRRTCSSSCQSWAAQRGLRSQLLLPAELWSQKELFGVFCPFAELDSPEHLRVLWSQIRSQQQFEVFCTLVFLFWTCP